MHSADNYHFSSTLLRTHTLHSAICLKVFHLIYNSCRMENNEQKCRTRLVELYRVKHELQLSQSWCGHSCLPSGPLMPRWEEGVHQFCCSVGQTWRWSQCLWFTIDCLLVCQVFRIAGPLTNWTHCLRSGGESSRPKQRGRGTGVLIVVYRVHTLTTRNAILKNVAVSLWHFFYFSHTASWWLVLDQRFTH